MDKLGYKVFILIFLLPLVVAINEAQSSGVYYGDIDQLTSNGFLDTDPDISDSEFRIIQRLNNKGLVNHYIVISTSPLILKPLHGKGLLFLGDVFNGTE